MNNYLFLFFRRIALEPSLVPRRDLLVVMPLVGFNGARRPRFAALTYRDLNLSCLRCFGGDPPCVAGQRRFHFPASGQHRQELHLGGSREPLPRRCAQPLEMRNEFGLAPIAGPDIAPIRRLPRVIERNHFVSNVPEPGAPVIRRVPSLQRTGPLSDRLVARFGGDQCHHHEREDDGGYENNVFSSAFHDFSLRYIDNPYILTIICQLHLWSFPQGAADVCDSRGASRAHASRLHAG